MTDPPPPAAGSRPPRGHGRGVDPHDPVVEYVMSTDSVSRDTAVEIVEVQEQAGNVTDAVRPVLGSRFGTVRIAGSGHIVVTVVDPGPADHTLADLVAEQCGIPGWVRIEEFEPEWIVPVESDHERAPGERSAVRRVRSRALTETVALTDPHAAR